MPTKPAPTTYRVSDVSGDPPLVRHIDAVTYEFNEQTGHHIFRAADGSLIANLVNVNVEPEIVTP